MSKRMYDYEMLARWLVNYRINKGWTQSELAERIGVSREIVHAFEHNRTKNGEVFLYIEQILCDAIEGFIIKGV